jgi:hypothetical protein
MAATDTPAARLATRPGALDLDRLTVIGVVGTPGAMRALVREPRGRVRTVSAGDRLRPGKVLRVEPGGLVIETRQGPALLPLAAPG